MIVKLVGSTLLRIYDLYARYPRRMLDLCALVAFLSILFGVLMGALVTACAYALDLLPDYYSEDLYILMFQGMFREHYGTVVDFTLFGLGLFAIHMRRMGEFEVPSAGFKGFWKSITARNWGSFAMMCTITFVIKLFFITPIFDTGSDVGYWEMGEESKSYQFAKWGNDLIAYVVGYIPVVLVMLMLVADEPRSGTEKRRRGLVPVTIAVLALVFAMNAIHYSLYDLCASYIFRPINILFAGSLIPAVLQLVLVMLLVGFLLPAFLLCFIGPLDARPDRPKGNMLDAFEELGRKEP